MLSTQQSVYSFLQNHNNKLYHLSMHIQQQQQQLQLLMSNLIEHQYVL